MKIGRGFGLQKVIKEKQQITKPCIVVLFIVKKIYKRVSEKESWGIREREREHINVLYMLIFYSFAQFCRRPKKKKKTMPQHIYIKICMFFSYVSSML